MLIQKILTFILFTSAYIVHAERCDAVVDEFSSGGAKATTAAAKVKTAQDHLTESQAIAKKNHDKMYANKKRQNHFSSPPRNRVRAEEMEKQTQGILNGYTQSNRGISQDISNLAKKLEYAKGDEAERYRAELIRLQQALLRNEKDMVGLRAEMNEHWNAVRD